MRRFLDRPMVVLLNSGDTALLRVFFAAASFGMAIWAAFDPLYATNHPIAVSLVSVHAQVLLFTVHSCATWYGVMTKRYSVPLLFCEGWAGLFLWFGIGLCEAAQQGAPGPMLVSGGSLAAFLLYRYPTHNTESR